MKIHPKVAAAGLAGAVTIVLVWAVKQFGGVEIPGEVASALTTIFSGAAGYLKS